MRLLKAAGHRRMPWKNGGGETIEIAVHPPGAGLAGFEWRVSMATVAADGPFSLFEGIDRTLSILRGAGMDLAVEGRGRARLTARSDPLSFPADRPAEARLHDGPITDLNVMTRRGLWRHRVSRLLVADGGRIGAEDAWTLVVPLAPCRFEADGNALEAGLGDVLVAEGPAPPLVVSGEQPVQAYHIGLWPDA